MSRTIFKSSAFGGAAALARYLPLLVFVFVFALSMRQLKDPDVWWHIKAGGWILQNRELPYGQDPFSYATSGPVAKKNAMTTQWLGDVAFYAAFRAGGLGGVSALRAMLLTAPFVLLYMVFIRRGFGPLWSILYLAAPAFIAVVNLNYVFERPQAFSFLFAALLVYVLETQRLRGGKVILFTVPLMLLWANVHGAYVVGLLIIIIYMASESLKPLLRARGAMGGGGLGYFLMVLAAAFLSAFLNPHGHGVFINYMSTVSGMLTSAFSSGAAGLGVPGEGGGAPIYAEWLPLWKFAEFYRAELWPPYAAAFIALSLLTAVFVWIKARAVDLTELLMAGFAAALGILMARGVIFSFVLLPFFTVRASGWGKRATSLAALGLLALWLATALKFGFSLVPETPKSWVDPRYPENTVRFMKDAGIEGRMFNYREWGGYLIFNDISTFADPRGVDMKVHRTYDHVFSGRPGWEGLLESYGVDYVLFPVVLPGVNYVPPLVVNLAAASSKGWVPVYFKENSVVFVRKDARYEALIEKFRVPKWVLFRDMLLWSEGMLRHLPSNGNIQAVRAVALMRIKEFPEGERFMKVLDRKAPFSH